MKIFDKLHISAVIKAVYYCFLTACASVFLLFFCYGGEEVLTKDTCLRAVISIFWLFLIVLVVYKIVTAEVRWICDFPMTSGGTMTVPAPLGNAIETSKEITDFNRRITAVHEAGHAVMAYLLGIEGFEVRMSNPNPRVVTIYKIADAERIRKLVLIYYAAAVAEELIFGKLYAGSMGGTDSDFSKATEMIKTYIVMTKADVSKSMVEEELLPDIIRYSKEFYEAAKSLLSDHKSEIEALANQLITKDSLTKEDVEALEKAMMAKV